MSKWMRNIYIVQGSFRKYLEIKKARTKAINIMWERQASLILNNSPRSLNRRTTITSIMRLALNTQKQNYDENILGHIKESYINQYLSDKISEYLSRKTKHEIFMKSDEGIYISYETSEKGSDPISPKYNSFITPNIKLFSDHDSLKEYIIKAKEESNRQNQHTVPVRQEFRTKSLTSKNRHNSQVS